MVNTIEKFLIKEQGIFTAAEAREAGIDNKKLQRSTSAGKLERVSRGLYMSTTAFEDEYFLAQYRCGKGVFPTRPHCSCTDSVIERRCA